MKLDRRKFIKRSGVMMLFSPLVPQALSKSYGKAGEKSLKVHIFSKHLQFLSPGEAGIMAAELGFDGLDLTVRPKGHVLPEKVNADLPVAIQNIREAGSSCEMITTAVSDAEDPQDINTVRTAGALDVKYYRSDWFNFRNDRSLEDSLLYYRDKVSALSQLNKRSNIIGCYQNHSGMKVGASIWEVKKILESADPAFFGAQYDIRHAVAEGGQSWPIGLKLISEQIKTIVLKDFKWAKVMGKWKIINVPIGEGMVDFKGFFRFLKASGMNPPASLHLEYPLGGAEKGSYKIEVDKKIVYNAMKKDLARLKLMWNEV